MNFVGRELNFVGGELNFVGGELNFVGGKLNFVGRELNFVGGECPPSPPLPLSPSPPPANPPAFRIEPALSASPQAYGERYKLILWHEVWGV